MKKNLFPGFLLLFTATITSLISSAQMKACFTDAFGYTWVFNNIQMTGADTYYGDGTVDAYADGRASISLNFSSGVCNNGAVEIHAINPNPDGCTFYSDSFVYVGTAVITKNGPGKISYSGNGTWNSYCFGSVINSGTWSASGPCGSTLKAPPLKTGAKPGDAKQKSNDITVKISPNPVKDYTHIEYKIASFSKVNITIYDIKGLPIKTLVNDSKAAGTYTISWNMLNNNGSKATQGLYKVVTTVNGKSYSTTLQVL